MSNVNNWKWNPATMDVAFGLMAEKFGAHGTWVHRLYPSLERKAEFDEWVKKLADLIGVTPGGVMKKIRVATESQGPNHDNHDEFGVEFVFTVASAYKVGFITKVPLLGSPRVASEAAV